VALAAVTANAVLSSLENWYGEHLPTVRESLGQGVDTQTWRGFLQVMR
jgi:hypothetical protein